MSTNSNIRIRRKDGSVTGIYCHWDGYIENNGVILQMFYNTAEKVEALLALGDISVLERNIAPADGDHTFDNPQAQTCIAYCRDRGEKFHQTLQDEEYVYIFDERYAVWKVIDHGGEETDLLDAITSLDLPKETIKACCDAAAQACIGKLNEDDGGEGYALCKCCRHGENFTEGMMSQGSLSISYKAVSCNAQHRVILDIPDCAGDCRYFSPDKDSRA